MRSTRSFLFSLLFSVTCLLLFSQCITTVGFNEPYIPVDGGGEITETKNEPTREIRPEPRSEPLHERTPEPVVSEEPSLADAPDTSVGDGGPDGPDAPDVPDVPDTNGQCQVYSKPCTLPGQGEWHKACNCVRQTRLGDSVSSLVFEAKKSATRKTMIVMDK